MKTIDSSSVARSRSRRRLAAAGAAVAVTAALLAVPISASAADPVDITLVSINDFHGRIDTNTVKWAGTIEQIIASSTSGNVAITGAGDLVGASLFASAVADDQPTIDVMNAIGLDASAVGNHEFDKGWPDLRDRIIGAPGARNAEWDYLGANVYDSTSGAPLLPEYSVLTFDGVRVGVIGAVTEETPTLVSPAGMVGVTIGDPVEAVNRVAGELSDGDESNGEAEVLVATFHEGAPSGTSTLEQNIAASAAFADIVNGVSAEVDVLLNGHTHQAYVYSAPVPGVPGATRPVLQTGSYGDFIGRVDLQVDPDTGGVTILSAVNVPRTTMADADLIAAYPGLVEVNQIVVDALANAAEVGNQPVGLVSGDITTAYANGAFGADGYQAVRNNANRDQRNLESSIGALVSNVLRDTLDPLGVDLPTDAATIGVVNPGGLRAELFYPASAAEGNGVVTYAEANSVLPFVNNLWTTHLTGAQVKTMLEQQWQLDSNGQVPTRAYLQLSLSDNVDYTFDPALPEGSRITSISVSGRPIDPAATYKIATFSFLVAGGDNFRVFTQGTSPADSGLVDRDAWIAYLQARAAAPGIAPDYVRTSAAVSPLPTTLNHGELLSTMLSYLDLTSLGAPASSSVAVAVGGVPLGSVPATFSPAANGNAAPVNGQSGTAAVSLTVPPTVPVGDQVLTFTVQPSGKVISVPVVVSGPLVAGAGGPYSIDEGDDLTLDASGSTAGATYEWDIDGDDVFTDASGVAPTLTWAQLEALGVDDGPAAHTVTLRVSFGDDSTTETAPLSVANTGPESVLTGALTATAGQLFTIKVGADDPSSADMEALFTYTVDWGDGSPVETVVGPADPPVSHTYTKAGSFAASFTATDKDGGTGSPTSVTVVAAPPATPPPSGGALPATGAESPTPWVMLGGALIAVGAGLVVARAIARRNRSRV